MQTCTRFFLTLHRTFPDQCALFSSLSVAKPLTAIVGLHAMTKRLYEALARAIAIRATTDTTICDMLWPLK